MRVDVDEPRQQRAAPAVDLGKASAGEARRPDVGDPAVADDDIAQALEKRRAGCVEDADVAQDERPRGARRPRFTSSR